MKKKLVVVALATSLMSAGALAYSGAEVLLGAVIGAAVGHASAQPQVIYQAPSVVYQQPPVVYQQPQVIYQQPPVVVEQPAIVYQRPQYQEMTVFDRECRCYRKVWVVVRF